MIIKLKKSYSEGIGDIVERIDFTCDVGESLVLTGALRRLADDEVVGDQYRRAAKKLCDEFRDAFTGGDADA